MYIYIHAHTRKYTHIQKGNTLIMNIELEMVLNNFKLKRL